MAKFLHDSAIEDKLILDSDY